MKIAHYTETPAEPATEADASGVMVRWVISEKDGAPNFCMRVFDIEPGGYTPSHQHPWEHEVIILEGEGIVVEDGQDRQIGKGDVIYVAPDEAHQFKNPSDDKLQLVCLVPKRN